MSENAFPSMVQNSNTTARLKGIETATMAESKAGGSYSNTTARLKGIETIGKED